MKHFLVLILILVSCEDEKDDVSHNCYDESIVHNNPCTADCPGIIGCDGEYYCNECEAARYGIKKAENLITFQWIETQCANPWDIYRDSLTAEGSFLKFMNINEYHFIDYSYKFDESLVEICLACVCNTGNLITFKSHPSISQNLTEFGFEIVE